MQIYIESGKKSKEYWHELWRYRELLIFLAWRDILVRYKQTIIGVGWSVVRPMLTMLVLTVVFSFFAKVKSDGIPYPVMVFAAMLPWQFFSSSFSDAGNSLVANSGMISKIYFPRLLMPLSSIIACFVDFFISAILLSVLMMYFGFAPSSNVLFLPCFVLMAIGVALGASFWVSALMVRYRDFRYIIPFIVQLGLYVSPVGFSSKLIPENWRLLYSVNPLVGVIDGFRWSIFGIDPLYMPGVLSSCTALVILVTSGLWYFRCTEKTFADVI